MTATPNFRALCAELVELLEDEWSGVSCQPEALNRARADLATAPPEAPTDQEIQEWADAKLGADQGDPEAFGLEAFGWDWRCFKEEAFARTIRAALERWGR